MTVMLKWPTVQASNTFSSVGGSGAAVPTGQWRGVSSVSHRTHSRHRRRASDPARIQRVRLRRAGEEGHLLCRRRQQPIPTLLATTQPPAALDADTLSWPFGAPFPFEPASPTRRLTSVSRSPVRQVGTSVRACACARSRRRCRIRVLRAAPRLVGSCLRSCRGSRRSPGDRARGARARCARTA